MKKLLILMLLILSSIVQAQSSKRSTEVEQNSAYTESLFQHENVYIGPQPELNDFVTLKAAGFTKVINMRTPAEMNELKFDEDNLLKKAGIDYLLLPIGGEEYQYSPAKLAEFAKSLDENKGKVLLHCRSGHRASQLWAAYLVKYKGKTPDQALALVKDMGWWPMPMEALLGKKLHVTVAE